MITGFNPTDMYAADHIKRVLTTFPGVFSGIGEFTIHKEFVSSKVAGGTATSRPRRSIAFSRLSRPKSGLLCYPPRDVDRPMAGARERAGVPRPDEDLFPPSSQDHHQSGRTPAWAAWCGRFRITSA